MVNLRRVFRDYRESGALHALIPVQTALGGGVFVTKRGDLLIAARLRGNGNECVDLAEADQTSRRFEAVLRIFDEHFRVYQYLLKRESGALPFDHSRHPVVEAAITDRIHYLSSKAEPPYRFDSYLAIVYEAWRPGQTAVHSFARKVASMARGFSNEAMLDGLGEELERSREFLANKVASFAVQCRDFLDVHVMNEDETYRFLRRLLNYASFKAENVCLKHNTFVDFQACDSALECHREFLKLDDYYVQVLTLKELPARTFAQMLRKLVEVPCEYILCSEWRREEPLRMRGLIQSKRRHFYNSKISPINYIGSGKSSSQDMLIDQGAAAVVANLGGCLEEMEVHGRSFGEFGLTLVLYSRDWGRLKRAAAQCFRTFATFDAQLLEERYNRLNAWLAMLPGNGVFNLRRLWVSSANYADLSFLYSVDQGETRNPHLGTEYLTLFESRGGAPYAFNLHVRDVAHTLILGATGSGKTFLLNFLLTHLQKYGPRTYIFDLAGSYETLTRLFEGSYLRLGAPKGAFTINPFCLTPTPENLLFLFGFVKVLIESNGYQLTPEDERDLYDQIQNLYSVSPDQRRLFTLANILHRNLRGPIQKWVQGGPYAGLFDNAEDNLTLARFQTFDFERMANAPDQCEPLLFYILHRANAAIHDATSAAVFKAFVMDEAWRFFRHPVIKAYIIEALKTWRQKNAAMILATQSGDDLLASDMLPTIVESCPTQIFLANPGMDPAVYRTAFHLNAAEAAAIAALIPKQQLLLKQSGVSKVLDLKVDPKGYWLYTNNPQDSLRRQETFARYGFQRGLEVLASESRGNT